MQSKSTRGVQQEDVWTAADALIAEGLRPTIERVRQKIGRGSPNTVSPMLEAWFATLGPRLGVSGTKEEEGDLPPPVRLAAAKLWDFALLSAQQGAAKALELAQQGLKNQRNALALRELELVQQAEVLNERQAASDAALADAKSQMANLNARLEEAHALLDRRTREIEQTHSKLAALEQQLTEERRQRDRDAERHAEERKRLDAHGAANERRLMEEVDRERQKVKQALTAAGEIERRAEASCREVEATNKALSDKLQVAEIELGAVRQALASAKDHSAELRRLLDEQRAAASGTVDQLNRLLAVTGAQKNSAPVASTKRKRRGQPTAN